MDQIRQLLDEVAEANHQRLLSDQAKATELVRALI
jgi:hypothetical protein